VASLAKRILPDPGLSPVRGWWSRCGGVTAPSRKRGLVPTRPAQLLCVALLVGCGPASGPGTSPGSPDAGSPPPAGQPDGATDATPSFDAGDFAAAVRSPPAPPADQAVPREKVACAARAPGFELLGPSAGFTGPVPCLANFCIENAPAAGPVRSVAGTSAQSLWAVGEGVLLHFDGQRWDTACAPLAGFDLWSSFAAAPGDAWLAGDRVLGHFDGTTWGDTPSPLEQQVPALWGSAQEAFALDFAGSIARWDGARWTVVYRDALAGSSSESLWGDARGGAWAVNGAGLLAWSAGSWGPAPRQTLGDLPFHVNDVWAPPGGPAWFAGFTLRNHESSIHDAALATLAAGGFVANPLPAPYREARWVRGSGPTEVWVGAIAGDQFSTTGDVLRWDGAAWSQVAWPSSTPWPPPLVLGPSRAFLADTAWDTATSRQISRVWRLGPSGWTPAVALDAPQLSAISGSTSTDVWALGDGFEVWRYDGAAWRRARAADGGLALSLSVASPGAAWVAGAGAAGGGRVLRWNGTSFDETTFEHPASQVYARGGEAWVAVDADGPSGASARIEHWDGSRWTELDTGAPIAASGVWASGPADVWLAGSFSPGPFARSIGVVLHYDGEAWARRDLPDHAVHALWGSGPADVWIAASTESCTKCPPIAPHAVVLHWDGHGFTDTLDAPLYTLSGTGPGDVWGASFEWPSGRSAPQSSVYHNDGSSWTRVAVLPVPFQPGPLWAAPGGDVWGVRSGRVVRRRAPSTAAPAGEPGCRSARVLIGSR
jgi:hypothetical protein